MKNTQNFKIKLFLLLSFFSIHTTKLNAQIDTLSNYTELIIYTGSSDSIFLNHDRYFGLFVQDTCTTTDYGTKIIGNVGCWQRIHQNFSPRFWALNGPSPDFIIGTIREEVDAINSAAFAAYAAGGDTIEIDSFYTIDRVVYLMSNNTYLGTNDNAGFRRIDSPKTVLTDTAFVGDEKIIVENNNGFRTRQKINIANNISFDSIAGFASYTASVSATLGGDTTILLSGLDITKQMLPGDSVGLFFPMMSPRFSIVDDVRIENLIFDGNRSSYTLNYDWRVNTSIVFPTSPTSVIENCRFYNIPAENIFLCGTTFVDCSGTDFNGSALHFSCNAFDIPTQVLYNNFSNLNQVGNAIMEHSEAQFTFSAKVQNLRVAYNKLKNGGEHGIGLFNNDDGDNEITDNLMDADLTTIGYNSFYNNGDGNLIYNNKNPNFVELQEQESSCFYTAPNVVFENTCAANSSFDAPLIIGDTIRVLLDSLYVRNSNNNYVKCVEPVFDDTYFKLVNVRIETPIISDFHAWSYDGSTSFCKGVVFDNGHRDGIEASGNWGFELCSHEGGCRFIEITFVVNDLPDSLSLVQCPLKGLNIKYDGEMETWDFLPTCNNETILFDNSTLGNPILKGLPVATQNLGNLSRLRIYPNPVNDWIFLENANTSNGKYQIFDRVGAVVESGELTSNRVAVQQLEAGFYILQLIHENEMYYGNFIKQ